MIILDTIRESYRPILVDGINGDGPSVLIMEEGETPFGTAYYDKSAGANVLLLRLRAVNARLALHAPLCAPILPVSSRKKMTCDKERQRSAYLPPHVRPPIP